MGVLWARSDTVSLSSSVSMSVGTGRAGGDCDSDSGLTAAAREAPDSDSGERSSRSGDEALVAAMETARAAFAAATSADWEERGGGGGPRPTLPAAVNAGLSGRACEPPATAPGPPVGRSTGMTNDEAEPEEGEEPAAGGGGGGGGNTFPPDVTRCSGGGGGGGGGGKLDPTNEGEAACEGEPVGGGGGGGGRAPFPPGDGDGDGGVLLLPPMPPAPAADANVDGGLGVCDVPSTAPSAPPLGLRRPFALMGRARLLVGERGTSRSRSDGGLVDGDGDAAAAVTAAAAALASARALALASRTANSDVLPLLVKTLLRRRSRSQKSLA